MIFKLDGISVVGYDCDLVQCCSCTDICSSAFNKLWYQAISALVMRITTIERVGIRIEILSLGKNTFFFFSSYQISKNVCELSTEYLVCAYTPIQLLTEEIEVRYRPENSGKAILRVKAIENEPNFAVKFSTKIKRGPLCAHSIDFTNNRQGVVTIKILTIQKELLYLIYCYILTYTWASIANNSMDLLENSGYSSQRPPPDTSASR